MPPPSTKTLGFSDQCFSYQKAFPDKHEWENQFCDSPRSLTFPPFYYTGLWICSAVKRTFLMVQRPSLDMRRNLQSYFPPFSVFPEKYGHDSYWVTIGRQEACNISLTSVWHLWLKCFHICRNPYIKLCVTTSGLNWDCAKHFVYCFVFFLLLLGLYDE